QNHGASHGVRSLKAHDRAEFRCLAGIVPAKALHSILLLGPGDPCRGSGRAAGGLRAAGACIGRGRCLYWSWPVLVLVVAGACTGRGRRRAPPEGRSRAPMVAKRVEHCDCAPLMGRWVRSRRESGAARLWRVRARNCWAKNWLRRPFSAQVFERVGSVRERWAVEVMKFGGSHGPVR